jgi:hypothetical protein
MMAKTRAIPSSPPGQIPSKEPGLVAGWLRRVTLTYFIAMPLVLMCALNETGRETGLNAVIKMEVDPPQVSYRRDLQTALRCFPGDWEVLNGIGKMSC